MPGRTGFIMIILSIFLSGCGALMPYKTEFQCKSPDKGKCATVKAAYDESKRNIAPGAAVEKNAAVNKDGKKDKGTEKPKEKMPDADPGEVYKNSLQKELSSLLEAPVTPVLIPPKVIRVLIFPYPDRKFLYMPRYVYMMTDEPEWVIGNYLIYGGTHSK